MSDATVRVIGDYEIRGELGRGGAGVVYLAYDRPLQRLVALKVLQPQFARDPVWLERFRREARAAAGLNHPNIVTLFKIAQLGQHHVIVMEYVEGMSLARLLKEKGPLDARRALHVTRQVAAALTAAHKSGVVHRDIKPHNILVNRAGVVKVTDFGSARLGEGAGSLSGGASVIGTPYYMSPEQCQTGEVDGRTDIYSLGVTLFEMLTGRVPFTGDTPLAVMYQICSEAFPDLSVAAPGVPAPVARMVSRMTASSASARYPEADTLLADVTSYMKHGVTPFADKGAAAILPATGSDVVPMPSASEIDDIEMPPLDFGFGSSTPSRVLAKKPVKSSRLREFLAKIRMPRWAVAVLTAAAFVLVALPLLFVMGRSVLSNKSPAATRIIDWPRKLDFPTDVVLGPVLMMDDSLAFPPPDKVDKGKIEILGIARGQIVVPAGKAAGLWIRNKELRDFSWLRHLDPDGLQVIMAEEVTVVRDDDLADFACQRSLRGIWIRSKEITDAGVAHLAHLSALQILSLGNSQMTDKSLAVIAQLPSLRGLAIGGSQKVTDEGIAHLANTTTLAYLKISGISSITDTGINSLSRLTGLHYLHMQGTSVTDDCIPALVRLTSLEELQLGDKSQITDEGVARLRAALPNCKVEK